MGKKNLVTFISMVSEILRYKLVKQKLNQKQDIKDVKKEINAITNSNMDKYPELTKHISLLPFVFNWLQDNCDINLDYFELNLNDYILFKNVASYNKVEPPKKKKSNK